MPKEKLIQEVADIKLNFGIGGCKIGEHYAKEIIAKATKYYEAEIKEATWLVVELRNHLAGKDAECEVKIAEAKDKGYTKGFFADKRCGEN